MMTANKQVILQNRGRVLFGQLIWAVLGIVLGIFFLLVGPVSGMGWVVASWFGLLMLIIGVVSLWLELRELKLWKLSADPKNVVLTRSNHAQIRLAVDEIDSIALSNVLVSEQRRANQVMLRSGARAITGNSMTHRPEFLLTGRKAQQPASAKAGRGQHPDRELRLVIRPSATAQWDARTDLHGMWGESGVEVPVASVQLGPQIEEVLAPTGLRFTRPSLPPPTTLSGGGVGG